MSAALRGDVPPRLLLRYGDGSLRSHPFATEQPRRERMSSWNEQK